MNSSRIKDLMEMIGYGARAEIEGICGATFSDQVILDGPYGVQVGLDTLVAQTHLWKEAFPVMGNIKTDFLSAENGVLVNHWSFSGKHEGEFCQLVRRFFFVE